MKDCEHPSFSARVEVQRLTDDDGRVRNYVAELSVACEACGLPFHFLGAETGLSFMAPTVNVGATTLHAPMAPGESTTIPSTIRFQLPGQEH